MSGSHGLSAAAGDRKGTILTSARSSVMDAVDQINAITAEMGTIADRVYGSELPTPGSKAEAQDQAIRPGEAGELSDTLDILRQSVTRLCNRFGRLTNGL